MMKLITILLAVVSSSTLTYHRTDEAKGLCTLAIFDDSKCSGLEKRLVDQGFIAGACPSALVVKCDASAEDDFKAVAETFEDAFSDYCGSNLDAVTYDYKCIQKRNMEIYHVENEGCGYVEFDVDKCSGMKEKIDAVGKYSPGPCPSTYAESNCEASDLASPDVAEAKAALGAYCDVDVDFTFNLACEPRMKTFHKIDTQYGACFYTDFDRLECTGLTKHLEDQEDFIPGPCPSKYTKNQCDSQTRFELDIIAALGTALFSLHCDGDTNDVTYGYGCDESSSRPKCPAECAKAIADDASTAADKANGIDGTGFCSTIMTKLESGKNHAFPDACKNLGEMTIGYCVTELYEKCVEGSEDLICPIPEYGLPPVLKDCEPKTCGEWKDAVDTGCAKEVSSCIKDELQGNLGCTKYGKDLKSSSLAPCGKTKTCGRDGEFCYFDDDLLKLEKNEGKCELCSVHSCALLTNDKAKTECMEKCVEAECTTDFGCAATCTATPKTCKQLKNVMESPTGCGKTCNQCYVDIYNAGLDCKGGDKAQSRIDGDSASALSILMLAIVAIFLWV